MKGLTATLSVLLIFSILLSLAVMISIKNREFNETLNKLFVADRVFAKYDGIESGLLGIMKEVFGINVTVQEGGSNIVTFQETLPHVDSNVYAYQNSLSNFTYFVNSYMNESNLQTSLNSDGIRDNLLLMVKPYDINYTHPITSEIPGVTRVLNIIPKSTANLNGYEIILNLTNAQVTNIKVEDSREEGSLFWNVTIFHTGGAPRRFSFYINPDDKVQYKINTQADETRGWTRIINKDVGLPPGTLTMKYHVNDIDNPIIIGSKISLNLTDVADKVKITLLPDIIKVNEVLYNIGRNDTAYIY